MAMPPTRWLNARNRSAAKLRSANWLLKNSPVIEAMANAFMNQDFCPGVKSSAPKKGNANGSQAPQMKNSRNIMMENLVRGDIASPLLSYNESGCHVRHSVATMQAPVAENTKFRRRNGPDAN